jgi:hypothetical protein
MGIQISISDSVLQAIRLPEQRIEQELRQELDDDLTYARS